MVSVDDYKEVKDCVYKGEHYSARDNGAIMRHPRKNIRKRKTDNTWTFGSLDKATRYMLFNGERVHRIVATAFHGEAPSEQHVVDHIDTNRQNNRPENLRWLTKLENILCNETTRKKVELICGSIEAFLDNPQLLYGYEKLDPHFSWMRSVSKEEAQICREHWSRWAKTAKPNPNYNKNESHIGEWIYNSPMIYNDNPLMRKDSEYIPYPPSINSTELTPMNHDAEYEEEEEEYEPTICDSLTPSAKQVEWKIPSEFPCCPQEYSDNPLEAYKAKLQPNTLFCKNKIYSSLVVDSAITEDRERLIVMTQSGEDYSVKPWAVSEIEFQDGIFYHISVGSYFTEDGARKDYTLAQGKEWTGGDVFDDFC